MPVKLKDGSVKPTFEELPLDAPVYQCEKCTSTYQEWESPGGDACLYCSNRMKLTKKAAVFLFRSRTHNIPYDKKLLKECEKVMGKN